MGGLRPRLTRVSSCFPRQCSVKWMVGIVSRLAAACGLGQACHERQKRQEVDRPASASIFMSG